jgi:hypothetical protein
MLDKELSSIYFNLIESKSTLKESPQTMPAPVKPKAPPVPGTKPDTDTPTKPARPADPFFPKPGQAPRPKARNNKSLDRFVAKRTKYKQ